MPSAVIHVIIKWAKTNILPYYVSCFFLDFFLFLPLSACFTIGKSTVKASLLFKQKSFKIHLCNFVRFQYIQADNRIRVIQWCWCSLHFRDKRGFLYIRQRLLNQIKKTKNGPSKLCKNCRSWAITVLKSANHNCFHHFADERAKKAIHTFIKLY